MFKSVIPVVLLIAVALGLSACGGTAPSPVETTQAVPDQSQIDSLQASCTRLDHTGDPARPDSVTLTCQDGDKIVIPGPIEPGTIKGSTTDSRTGAVASKDGLFYIPSESGKHYVWYFLMTDSGEFRVWHDDQRIQRTSDGEKLTSKVAIRDFKNSAGSTSYLGW